MIKELIYSVIFVVALIILVKFKLLTVEQVSSFLDDVGGVIKMIGRVIIDGIISIIKMI